MSEEEQEVRDRRRFADTAAAESSPDENTLLMKQIEMFVTIGKWWAVMIGAFQANIWTFAKFAVPAMALMIPILDKCVELISADNDYKLQASAQQAEIEIKRLDRTMLGEGAMVTLNAISGKLDQQATQSAKIQEDVQRLAADVGTLKAAQAITDRKVGGLASSQAQLRDRLNKAP